jgi:hypothetical protein
MTEFDESICYFRDQIYSSGSWACDDKVCAKCDNGKWASSFHSDYIANREAPGNSRSVSAQ